MEILTQIRITQLAARNSFLMQVERIAAVNYHFSTSMGSRMSYKVGET